MSCEVLKTAWTDDEIYGCLRLITFECVNVSEKKKQIDINWEKVHVDTRAVQRLIAIKVKSKIKVCVYIIYLWFVCAVYNNFV